MSADERIPAAVRVLADHGVHGATIDAEGHQREIAAIRVAAGDWERMMGPEGTDVADAVKAAGFRYVALDLAPADGEGDEAPRGLAPSDDEGLAGWDAFPPPDDAVPAPRSSPRPLDGGRLRSDTMLLAGLTAVQVLRYTISPNAVPLQAMVLQWGVCASAGFLAARAGHLRVRGATATFGIYIIATAAAQAVASFFGVAGRAAPVTVGQVLLPALAAAAAWLAGGWFGLRRRTSRHVMT